VFPEIEHEAAATSVLSELTRIFYPFSTHLTSSSVIERDRKSLRQANLTSHDLDRRVS
jgi:hypothetical protein